jgi:hypothetical protein
MSPFSPRLRATLSIAAAWAVATAGVGGLVALALALAGLDAPGRAADAPALLRLVRAASAGISAGVTLGGLAGLTFAALLAWLERRRSVHALSTGRLAAWGAAAGAFWPLIGLAFARLTGPASERGGDGPLGVVQLVVAFALVGACLGALTLGVARRADARVRGV